MSDENQSNEEIQGPPIAPEGTPVAAEEPKTEEPKTEEPEAENKTVPGEPAAELPPDTGQVHESGDGGHCPVCGMSACGHNLKYTKASE